MFIYSARLAAQGQQAVRDLGRLAAAIPAGRRDLLEAAVDQVGIPAITRQFATSGSEDPWAELSEATMARRERAGTGTTPLVASGAGMQAATSRHPWVVTRTEASYPAGGWSTAGGYVRHHQEGTRDGHVPARPFGRLEAQDADRLQALGLEWLDGRLRGAGW